MKPIHLIAVVLSTLLLSSFSVSSNTTSECTDQTLHEELQSLLKSPDLIVENESSVRVILTANDQGEVIVLSVKTNDSEIDEYVKDRLNYRQLCNTLEPGTMYSLPITLKSR